MSSSPLLIGLAVVLAQTALLYAVSRRLLLGYVLGTLASRLTGPRGRRLIALIRLPGNLVHELSHAAAYLATGYRIRRFATCWRDPEGRGFVETGPPWSAFHWAPLSAALSCAAPLVVGAVVLRGLGLALGLELPEVDLISGDARAALAECLRSLPRSLLRLDWSAWQTYVFWLAAFSLGAELAPSPADVRQGRGMLAFLLLLAVVALAALPHMELRPATAAAIAAAAQWLLGSLSAALFAGLLSCGLVGVVAAVLTWPLRRAEVR